MLSRQSILIFVLTMLSVLSIKAQNSMGVGTDTPNPNAVLELVSPTGNQGFLVTRYTTAERTATSFTTNLSASDNGLMVFDTDENTFYVWVETQWQSISNQAVSAGSGISIDGSGVITNTGDLDMTNEIQDLDLTSDILTITNNGSAANIDLTPYLDDTNTQLTESEVDGFVANNGYLEVEVDGSVTNEIQDLSLSSDILTITNNGSATDIDLTPYLDDTNTQLTESEVDGFVANNGYLEVEADGSVTNEIQDLSLVSDVLTITNNSSATNIDLTPYLDDTNTQLTESEVDGFVANNGYIEAEADGSVTNEIQDLSLSSDILTITNNGSATNIDLSTYMDNTDAQDAASVPYNNTLVAYLTGENAQDAIDELATDFNDVGNLSGTTVSDNADVISALQQLETAVESASSSTTTLQEAYNNGATITTSSTPININGLGAITLGSSASNIALVTAANLEFSAANFSLLSTGDMNVFGGLNVNDGLTGNINPTLTVERSDGNSASSIRFLNADGDINIGMTTTEDFAVSAPGSNIGLTGDYFRISNAGDVGVGVVNPSAKLDVGGSAEINGNLTTVGNVFADSYSYNNAVSKRVTIGVHQFRPEILDGGNGDSPSLIVSHGNGTQAAPFISGASDPDAHLSASVNLPDGAVLTFFEAQLYRDASSAEAVMMQLYRKTISGAPELMSTVTYSTTPGTSQLVSETDFGGFEVIDNTNYQYWLRFTGEGGDGLSSYTAGVRLSYTVTSLD